MTIAIHWFRRDLRLTDNTALARATVEADQVIGLFVLDPNLLDNKKMCEARIAFLYQSLAELAGKLEAAGSRLIVRRGNPLAELQQLIKQAGAAKLYYNRDYTSYARKRDQQVEDGLKDFAGLEVISCKDLVIFEKEELLTGGNTPFKVYTSYKNRWLRQVTGEIPGPAELRKASLKIKEPALKKLTSLTVPQPPKVYEKTFFMPAGEDAAARQLAEWTGYRASKAKAEGAVGEYADNRNLVGVAGTSRLSAFLRSGTISPRQCYREALEAHSRLHSSDEKNSCETWISELVWRDFFYQVIWNFPWVAGEAYQPKFRKLRWQQNEAHFKAWCEGRTGYPVVDAGMRQLNTMNWMHNRARMITASFLVKDLRIDWRLGERYFWEKLVDYDQPSNNGNWQWVASTGADAQPYFRIFNPTEQGKKYDPAGRYVREWVPELANVPDKYIHTPEKMPEKLQKELGVIIGKDYPAPLVIHAETQSETLDEYRRAARSG